MKVTITYCDTCDKVNHPAATEIDKICSICGKKLRAIIIEVPI